jgi:hypothetical protein
MPTGKAEGVLVTPVVAASLGEVLMIGGIVLLFLLWISVGAAWFRRKP